MSTALHSFIDIFDTTIGEGQNAVQLNRIVIPIIQRDYAQGRRDPEIDRIRHRFLDSLYEAVSDKPVTLDFIYGDVDENGIMTPLDGQQRLTTLFLLHWYAAKKENIPPDEMDFLNKFGYETRYSARYFCKDLVDFNPSFTGILSKEIINQAWFPLEWQKDPTISSMLVMIDAIDLQFKKVSNLWAALKNRAITFYFLPIKDMGLTDELYIRMNSRGKPLTQFEHFKAELEREMRCLDEQMAGRISEKIDRSWTDLLWHYRNDQNEANDDNTIDDEFLRYFKFVCDVLCYKSNKSPQEKSNDEFDLLREFFSAKSHDANKNYKILESFFDCWCSIPGYDSPTKFLESFMSRKHEQGKIIVDSKNAIDIFEDCLHSYSDKSGRIRQFPLNRIVLLYAITVYLQNKSTVSYDAFRRRIRIVNNLIQNSEDEISDRSDRNRLPAILLQIDSIILNGRIDDNIENSFNVNQLAEEKEKITFLENNPGIEDTLFTLEDNPMLYGQISIIGLENLSMANRFNTLFNCKWDKIDCAMMSIGNYGQTEKRWRHQFGSKVIKEAWDRLFHKSANDGFNKTKNVLLQLLSLSPNFTNEVLDQISNSFITSCESKNLYPWEYYYVKYSVFRPGSYGKLSNDDRDNNPYLFSVMQTRLHWSENTYMPFLKASDDKHLSRDHMGQRLIYGDEYIICANNSYLRKKNDNNATIDTIMINQNEEGVDTEDRIVKLKNYIANNFNQQ